MIVLFICLLFWVTYALMVTVSCFKFASVA